MSSGLVTITTKSRRVSRRRRNKDKSSSKTTTAKTQPEIQPITNNKSVEQPVPATVEPVPATVEPIPKPLTKQIPSEPAQKSKASTNNKPVQQSKPSQTVSVWTQRAQAKKAQKPKQSSKPKPKPKPKPVQSNPIKTKPISVKNKGPTQQKSLRSGRGFSARKVAYKFDPNSVDMNHQELMHKNPKQTTEEAFPSLQKGKKKKSELRNSINNINKTNRINSEKKVQRISGSGNGYRHKKVATIYDPNSVDMTKKPLPRKLNTDENNDENKAVSSNSNYNGGLSSRSNGFRFKRTYSENMKPRRTYSENMKPRRTAQNTSNYSNNSNNNGQSVYRSIRPKPGEIKYSG